VIREYLVRLICVSRGRRGVLSLAEGYCDAN